MPILYVDPEAAELTALSIEMLQAALTARVKRADPEQIISNPLKLQSNKLAGVLAQLLAPEPRTFDMLSEREQAHIRHCCDVIARDIDTRDVQIAWAVLRSMLVASPAPAVTIEAT